MTIEALVFDFDGLILDTEGPVFTAWQEEFEAHGCPPLTIEEWAAEIGTTGGLDLVELIRARATRLSTRRRCTPAAATGATSCSPGNRCCRASPNGWTKRTRSAWARDRVELPGTGSSPISSGSGSGSGSRTSCASVPESRASPRPIRTWPRARLLGVEPSRAIAIEDSPHGVSAAKAAGLRCVAVPHAITEQLDLSHADLRLRSLAAMTLPEVLAHFDAQPGARRGTQQLAATAPRALALPLVQRPRHLVLVVLARMRRQDADEIEPSRVHRGAVPRRRQELIRAVVTGRAHDVVLPGALASACTRGTDRRDAG